MRQSNILFHPTIVLIAGCLIAISVFGPRSTFGLFLEPITATRGWGRDVFALAMAIQQLLWGLLQPIGGIISDRFGIWWALLIGAVFYGLGIVAMSVATTPALFYVSGGLLIGIGL